MNVTENIILNSIAKTLKDIFGIDYKYYTETITEGFKKPSFHVYKINSINKNGLKGTEYSHKSKSYRYIIRYFTNSTNAIIKDINDKLEILDKDLNYINLYYEENEITYNGQIRIIEQTSSVNDGVLQYEITFNTNIFIYDSKEKVKYIELDLKNKGGI